MNIVEKFGGISVPSWGDFRDFKSPQGKNFHRRDGTARGPIPELRRGELRQRNFPRDAWTSDSRQQKRDSGSDQIRAEVVVCWELTRHQKQRERQKQQRRVAESCNGGIDPARVLLIWLYDKH